jgi:phenylalanyl-tRNA synthetase beta chain
MRVPLSWLQDYVPLQNIDPLDLAHRLTMAGLETTFEQGGSQYWNKVLVGQIVSIEKHPNADRLQLATVDTGDQRATVVCGAPNIEVGQKIAYAQLGARLLNAKTGETVELTAAKIRGVESAGMICSELELGLSSNHHGILVLPEESSVGSPINEILDSSDAFEIEITANRGDCLSVLGVAHEVAAIIGAQVTEPNLEYEEVSPSVEECINVIVEDSQLCQRYACTLTKGIKVEDSPEWLQKKLRDSGHRPINNVVDITNFVMLEYGQPLHAFDYDQILESTLIVRTANSGETFTSLDGALHELKPPMLMITDPQRSIGIAGVMGGLNSEMTKSTKNVLLESATFNGINTRRTASTLKLRTEASLRFEKGLNPELAERALKRATALIHSIAGGEVRKGIYDVFPGKKDPLQIQFSLNSLQKILGTSYPISQVEQVLNSLGFVYTKMDDLNLKIQPPYWRTDIEIEEDIVEEIARAIGYDSIPDIPLAGLVPQPLNQPIRILREKVKDLLVSLGLQETISHSLVSEQNLESINTPMESVIRTENPMSREQEFLRASLIPELLGATSEALKHPPNSVAFFETGRSFKKQKNDLPIEDEMAVGVLAGIRSHSFWEDTQETYDFFDAKGIIEAIFANLGVQVDYIPSKNDTVKIGHSAELFIDGTQVGMIGEINPLSINKFNLPTSSVVIFELNLSQITQFLPKQKSFFVPFSRYPAAIRDLALVVKSEISAEQIETVIRKEAFVTRVSLFDLYEGGSLSPGEKSLAFRVEVQSSEGTLTTEQLDAIFSKILQMLAQETGAVTRT